MNQAPTLLIGLVSVSDRASAGVYQDQGIPGLVEWFTAALRTPWQMQTRLIPDEQALIESTLIELVDSVGCHLVLTTGLIRLYQRDPPVGARAIGSLVREAAR